MRSIFDIIVVSITRRKINDNNNSNYKLTYSSLNYIAEQIKEKKKFRKIRL